jgi:hypothetical protein
VIAAPRLLDVFALQPAPTQFLQPLDRFEHGDAVAAAAAEVVDGSGNRALAERHDRRADVVGVNVVADLLALVAEDPVGTPLSDRARDVREKAVQFGAGVIRSGQTPSPETHGRHAEVAAVLLHQDIPGHLRGPEEAVHRRVDAAGLVDPVLVRRVCVVPASLELDERQFVWRVTVDLVRREERKRGFRGRSACCLEQVQCADGIDVEVLEGS